MRCSQGFEIIPRSTPLHALQRWLMQATVSLRVAIKANLTLASAINTSSLRFTNVTSIDISKSHFHVFPMFYMLPLSSSFSMPFINDLSALPRPNQLHWITTITLIFSFICFRCHFLLQITVILSEQSLICVPLRWLLHSSFITYSSHTCARRSRLRQPCHFAAVLAWISFSATLVYFRSRIFALHVSIRR